MERRKNGKRIIAAAALIVFILTGCSSMSEDEAALIAAADAALTAGDYQEAAKAYEEAAEAGIAPEDSLRGLGIARMGTTDYEGAQEALEAALKESNGIPGAREVDINYYLASCCYQLGDRERALEIYDAILKISPKEAPALELRGSIKVEMGQFDAGIQDLRSAISLDETDYDRMISVLQTLDKNGHREEGLQIIRSARERGGNSLSDYDRGRLSYYLEDYETAKTSLEQARSRSDDYQCASMLGQTYEKLGDYNYAVSLYQNYLTSDKSHAEIYNRLGLCLLKMGNYKDALTAFEDGLTGGDASMAQILEFNRIVALEYLGQFKKASVLMDAYMDRYPWDTEAEKEYTFLKTR